MEQKRLVVKSADAQAFAWAVHDLNLPAPIVHGQMEVDADRLKHALACGLALIDPKQPLGTELFDALCRLTVTPAIEAVCVRRLSGSTFEEVLLTKRADNDAAYPGQWHCPGTALRPGEAFEDAFNRLGRGEFFSNITGWRLIEIFNHLGEARGHFLSLIFLCHVEEVGDKAHWYPVNQLPENTIAHHREHIIPPAVEAYRRGASTVGD